MASQKPDTWQAVALSIYPEMFPGPLGMSLAGTALKDGAWSLQTWISAIMPMTNTGPLMMRRLVVVPVWLCVPMWSMRPSVPLVP